MTHYLLIVILCLNACAMPQKTASFAKQGHRGCRGLVPENTIAAMQKAIELGVTTLEMDIVFTADQQAILSHEPFFNHEITTKPDGSFVDSAEEKALNIYRMSYEKVRQFDVGLKPHSRFPQQIKLKAEKPLLAAVIDSVEDEARRLHRPPLQYNIETKTTPATDNIFHPAPDRFVQQLMQVIVAKNITSRVTIQSFDIRTLQYLHEHYPEVRTSLLIERSENKTIEEKIKALGFTPNFVSPEFEMVTPALVKKLHDEKIQIIPWTVNDAHEIKKLKEMHVDGVITDYPNLFHHL